MKRQVPVAPILGILLAVSLVSMIMRKPLLAAGSAVALLLVLHQAWRITRATLRTGFSRPLDGEWAEAPPAPLAGRAAELDTAWKELGYTPVGFLLPEEAPSLFFAIYLHPELPIYAAILAGSPGGATKAAPYLLTFWERGGKVTTTATADIDVVTAWVETGAPRLVQFRPAGTPAALDGQHVGTVRAWMAGNRQPLPATREALIGYAQADHHRLRDALEAAGWLPFGAFLRLLVGRPAGILKF